MPKLPIFLAGLAIAVSWTIYARWTDSEAQSPEALLASAEKRVAVGPDAEVDYDAVLHELGLALESAELRGERALLERAYELRAEVLRDVGALEPAIDDFTRLLSGFRPDDESLQLTLASLHQRRGDFDRAYELVQEILEEDPQHSGALVQLGHLHAGEADELLAQCDEILYRSLPQDLDERGHDLARRVASRDVLDPTRVALLQELLELFGPLSARDSRLAEDLLKGASYAYARAREAYTSAMEQRPNPQAYAGFLEILASAGRFREAARFGLAALAHRPFRNDPDATGTLARALAQTGDLREAAAVARETLQRRTSLEEAREWALLMYRAEQWGPLKSLVRTLEKRAPAGIAGEPIRREAAFYDGMIDYGRGRAQPALLRLLRYVRLCDELEEEAAPLPGSVPASPDLEDEPQEIEELPYEGARADAHLALAAMFGRQRNGGNEFKQLRRVVELHPDPPNPVWRRLHSLEERRQIDPRIKVDTLTRVLCFDPDPDGQLMSKWHQLGRAALKADEKDPLDANARELRAEGQWYPEGDVDPYELYVLAQDHRRAGQPQGALVCLRLLLDDHPGFRPAQDELIAQYREARRWDPLTPVLLDRIERWGTTPDLLDTLRAIPDEVLSLEQRLLRMRLDPLHSGVYAMSAHLAERGDAQRALQGLLTLGEARLDSEGRVLAGELLLQLGRYARALELLYPIPVSDPQYSRATALRIEASLASRDSELLMAGVQELAGAERVDAAELLRISDALAREGRTEPALYLLERLDSQPETRHGSVFQRQAFHHLMAGELAEAEEDLLRAEAYLSNGVPLLGRLLIAAERGDFNAIPGELALLRGTSWTPRPLQAIAALALEDRLEEARAMLDTQLASGRPPHQWLLAAAALSTLQGLVPPALPFGTAEERREAIAFVSGGAGRTRDARETFVLLLALEDAAWRPWVLRRLDALEATEPWADAASDAPEDTAAPAVPGTGAPGGTVSDAGDAGSAASEPNPVYAFLRALTHDLLGDAERATEEARRAIEQRRDFEPGWELLERLVRSAVQHPDDPALLILRQQRRTALGRGEDNVAEGLLLEAQELAAAGQLEDAIAKAQWALREDRRLVHARILLTRLEVLAGRYRAAQANFDRLFRDLPPAEADELVPEYVRALERFLDRGIVEATEAARDLAGLVRSLPRNPEVALALARMELRAAGANVHAGVSRVWRRLDELRARLDGDSIESLSDTALRDWYEFAASLDPRRAEALVREELELDPHCPDLWLMRGEALEAQYHDDAALEQYQALLDLFPEKPVLRRVTALMARRSASPDEIEARLYESVDLHGWRLEDLAVRAMLARAYASGGPEHLDVAIGLYDELWRERAAFGPDDPSLADVGQEYGEALLRRGLRSDRRLARQVFDEVEPLIVDGPRRDLCRALGNMARFLPVKPPKGGAGRGESGGREEPGDSDASPDRDQRSAAAGR